MARILICHVPKDGSIARDVGSALMARGHFVSFDGEPDAPRADRSTRLRQFEAVVVVWTETSYQSVGLAQIARDMLPLNVLIPVRSDDLAISRLPLTFRKLNMLSPRDFDGLGRLIARLSSAASSMKDIARQVAKLEAEPRGPLQPIIPRAPAPAAGPRQPRTEAIIPAQHAQHTARSPLHLDLPDVTDSADVAPLPEAAVSTPNPLVSPPLAPKAWKPTHAHNGHQRFEPAPAAKTEPAVPLPEEPSPYSAIANAQEFSQAIEAGLLLHYIPEMMWLGEAGMVEVRLDREVLEGFFSGVAGGSLIETLSLSLYGTGDAFEIERLSERTQPVGRHASAAGEGPKSWSWLVTPHVVGRQDLVVRVSAVMLDRHGVPAPVALPDRRFRVDIGIREGARVMSSLSGWERR